MTRKQVKHIIRFGTKLQIQSAIFERWKLKDRPLPRKPYKDD